IRIVGIEAMHCFRNYGEGIVQVSAVERGRAEARLERCGVPERIKCGEAHACGSMRLQLIIITQQETACSFHARLPEFRTGNHIYCMRTEAALILRLAAGC